MYKKMKELPESTVHFMNIIYNFKKKQLCHNVFFNNECSTFSCLNQFLSLLSFEKKVSFWFLDPTRIISQQGKFPWQGTIPQARRGKIFMILMNQVLACNISFFIALESELGQKLFKQI